MSHEDLDELLAGTGMGTYNIRARQAGKLGHQAVLTGAYVATDELIGTVTDDERWLKASIPSRLAMGMRQGQRLAVSGYSASLTLMQMDQEIDPRTQTVDILARFDGPVEFMPGQLINLIIPPVENGVVIPSEAVVHSGDETLVYVKAEGGVVSNSLSLTPLGADYLASGGIAAGTEIVVRGAAIVKGIQLGLGGE